MSQHLLYRPRTAERFRSRRVASERDAGTHQFLLEYRFLRASKNRAASHIIGSTPARVLAAHVAHCLEVDHKWLRRGPTIRCSGRAASVAPLNGNVKPHLLQ